MSVTHGRPGTYVHGCRCPPCTEANTARQRKVKLALAARAAVGDPAVPHGLGGYGNWGCRCPVCTQAQSDTNARGRARRKLAAGQPMTALTDRERAAWVAKLCRDQEQKLEASR